MDTVEEVIQHFGVRGMKWGVRRDNPSGGSGRKPKKGDKIIISVPEATRAREVKTLIKNHGLSAATNSDLKMLSERVALESQYHKLFPPKKSIAQRGAKIAGDILMSVGQQQAKSFMNQTVAKQVDLAVNGPIPLGKHSKKS